MHIMQLRPQTSDNLYTHKIPQTSDVRQLVYMSYTSDLRGLRSAATKCMATRKNVQRVDTASAMQYHRARVRNTVENVTRITLHGLAMLADMRLNRDISKGNGARTGQTTCLDKVSN